ncbi:MAG: hypothetical protein KME42_17855 [Tildeniella nuda ZEHNDER 1965/U140]|nr:hypothetical protein [Tildeniella nuda ZEHNDER 1965/U140]
MHQERIVYFPRFVALWVIVLKRSPGLADTIASTMRECHCRTYVRSQLMSLRAG